MRATREAVARDDGLTRGVLDKIAGVDLLAMSESLSRIFFKMMMLVYCESELSRTGLVSQSTSSDSVPCPLQWVVADVRDNDSTESLRQSDSVLVLVVGRYDLDYWSDSR